MGKKRGSRIRFEEQVGITIECCRKPMRLVGNLSLRGSAGAKCTRLAYECEVCFRRATVIDQWPEPNQADLNVIDSTP